MERKRGRFLLFFFVFGGGGPHHDSSRPWGVGGPHGWFRSVIFFRSFYRFLAVVGHISYRYRIE